MSNNVRAAAERCLNEQPMLMPAFFRRDVDTVARFALDALAARSFDSGEAARLRAALLGVASWDWDGKERCWCPESWGCVSKRQHSPECLDARAALSGEPADGAGAGGGKERESDEQRSLSDDR